MPFLRGYDRRTSAGSDLFMKNRQLEVINQSSIELQYEKRQLQCDVNHLCDEVQIGYKKQILAVGVGRPWRGRIMFLTEKNILFQGWI
jgi:hypothetical protein